MARSSYRLFLLAAAIAFIPLSAFAERYVVVNGQRLNDAQIEMLEGIQNGPIPNGAYWLDVNTGIWGYAGDPRPMGCIFGNAKGRHLSLSERGLLYSPGEILSE
jgi:hypothetical protein